MTRAKAVQLVHRYRASRAIKLAIDKSLDIGWISFLGDVCYQLGFNSVTIDYATFGMMVDKILVDVEDRIGSCFCNRNVYFNEIGVSKFHHSLPEVHTEFLP